MDEFEENEIERESYFELYVKSFRKLEEARDVSVLSLSELNKSRFILKTTKLIAHYFKPEVYDELDKIVNDVNKGIDSIERDEIILDDILTFLVNLFVCDLTEEEMEEKLSKVLKLLNAIEEKNYSMPNILSKRIEALTTRIKGIDVQKQITLNEIIDIYDEEYNDKDKTLTLRK